MKIRNFCAVLVALLCVCAPIKAQRALQFRHSDGLNLSSLVGIDNTALRPGFYSTLGVTYYFSDYFGIGTEVAYSEQGTHCKANDMGVVMNYNYNYLNLPLLATCRLSEHNVAFVGGVQFGKLLKATYNYTAPSILGQGGSVSGGGVFDKSEFHPWDVGVTLGVDWTLFPRTGCGIELRYTLGITQTHNGISDTANGNIYISVPDNRNSTLRVGLFVPF